MDALTSIALTVLIVSVAAFIGVLAWHRPRRCEDWRGEGNTRGLR